MVARQRPVRGSKKQPTTTTSLKCTNSCEERRSNAHWWAGERADRTLAFGERRWQLTMENYRYGYGYGGGMLVVWYHGMVPTYIPYIAQNTSALFRSQAMCKMMQCMGSSNHFQV